MKVSETRRQTRGKGEGKTRTRGTGTDTLSVVTATEETVNTTDGELETSLGRTGLSLRGGLAAGLSTRLSTGRHV
jgi:hypothetical protein